VPASEVFEGDERPHHLWIGDFQSQIKAVHLLRNPRKTVTNVLGND
jgi:hypothetical protein